MEVINICGWLSVAEENPVGSRMRTNQPQCQPCHTNYPNPLILSPYIDVC